MWSTNLEAQADLTRERFAQLRRDARRHAQQRAERLAERRQATRLATHTGRLLARTGAWLVLTGRRLQQDEADCAPAGPY